MKTILKPILVGVLSLLAPHVSAGVIVQNIDFANPAATPEALYALYLAPERQNITRGKPAFAWNFETRTFSIGHDQGFVTSGRILDAVAGKRIVHTWKTSEYKEGEEGLVTVSFLKKADGSTRIELVHVLPDRLEANTALNWTYFHWMHWKKKFGEIIPIPAPF